MAKKQKHYEAITTVRSHPDWKKRVTELAKESGLSTSEFIRIAVRHGAKQVFEDSKATMSADTRYQELKLTLESLIAQLERLF